MYTCQLFVTHYTMSTRTRRTL